MAEPVAISEAVDLIKGEADVAAAAKELCEHKKLKKYVTADLYKENYLATSAAVRNETVIWDYLQHAADPNPLTEEIDVTGYSTIEIGGMTLDESQAKAVRWAINFQCSCITGGAGSGKTLVARAIHKAFVDAGISVTLIAPTGKAARRLKEVIGSSAATIPPDVGFLAGWRIRT